MKQKNQSILKYYMDIPDFLNENLSDTKYLLYDLLIKKIKKLKLASDYEILNLIIENIDDIIKDNSTFFPFIMQQISCLLNIASNEQIRKIDIALVRNVDVILGKNISENKIAKYRKDNWYNFHWFDKMEKFKQEIKKRGIEFFIKFPLKNDIEEYRETSEELFGNYDEKAFSILEFGQYDKTKALLMESIIRGFLKQSN